MTEIERRKFEHVDLSFLRWTRVYSATTRMYELVVQRASTEMDGSLYKRSIINKLFVCVHKKNWGPDGAALASVRLKRLRRATIR